jgi:hypothetical protein
LLVLPGGLFDDHQVVILFKWLLLLLEVTERCERVGINPKGEFLLLLMFLKLVVKVKEIV